MKKQIIFFVVMLMIHSFSKAQQQLDINKIRHDYINLPSAKSALINLPISNIEILDARLDNLCIGFVKVQTLWEKSPKEALQDYITIDFTNNLEKEVLQNIMPAKSLQINGFNFLFVIKELWLYDNDNSLINAIGKKLDDTNSSGLLFRADIYLNRNSKYIPLFQMDSIFILKKSLKPRLISDLLQNALSTLCEKINALPIFTVFDKATRAKSRTSIDSFYNHVNKFTFIKFTDTLHQYAFNTFEDFKNGNYTNVKLRQFSDRTGDYYYNKDEIGNEYLVRDYAFYDKGNFFIKTNNTYSKLFFNNNKIYTIGSKLFTNGTSIPVFIPLGGGSYVSGNVNQNNGRRSYQLMMLDMQTGNTY